MTASTCLLKTHHTPSRLAPIFLFTNWRTGGTALAFTFRKLEQCYVYTEPLNPTLRTPQIALDANTSSWNSKHPANEHYFTEYEPLFNNPDWDDIFPNVEELPYVIPADAPQEPLKKYLLRLISYAQNAGKIPIFKFEQMEGGAEWIKHNFPDATLVGLTRAPENKYISWLEQATYGNPSIFYRTLHIINKNIEYFDTGNIYALGDYDTRSFQIIFSIFDKKIREVHSATMDFCINIAPESQEAYDEQVSKALNFDPTRADIWCFVLEKVHEGLIQKSINTTSINRLTRHLDTISKLNHARAERDAVRTELCYETNKSCFAFIKSKLKNTAIGVKLRHAYWLLIQKPATEIFQGIYKTNYWHNSESRSGHGSTLLQTSEIRHQLPTLIKSHNIGSMLDIPCGDWHWMKEVPLDIEYIGADIVPELIQHNQELHGDSNHHFITLDLTQNHLPRVDLIFSRDIFVHLSFNEVHAAINNIKRSNSRYLLATTFNTRKNNIDCKTGNWRPLNLQAPPFNFPNPLVLINEKCTEGNGRWSDKCLGLWRIDELPSA